MLQDGDGKSDLADVAGALAEVADWLETTTGDAGWLAALRFGVAGALAHAGDAARAEAGFRRILSERPDHLWSWIGLIDLAMARGGSAAALALGHDGLAHLPKDRLLRRKTAEAAERSQGPAAALDILSKTDANAWMPEDLGYVIALHRAAQSVDQAEPFCDALLAERPGDAVALLARVEAKLTKGDGPGAVAAGLAALDHHPTHAEIRLRAAQAHLVVGDPDRAWVLAQDISSDAEAPAELRQALEHIAGGLPNPAEVSASLDTLLAEGPTPKTQAAFLDQLRRCPGLPWYGALALVAEAMGKGAVELATQISATCAGRSWSATDRQAFAIEDTLLRIGPLAALDQVRAHPRATRDAEGAERVGRVLRMAGTGPLAARYLRRACRRWPDHPMLLTQAAEAMIACGTADAVAPLCDGQPEGPEAQASRLRAALSLGDIAAAVAQTGPALPDRVEAHLLVGDLAGAEACLAQLSITDGPLAEALICRPRATRLGAILNEARVLAALGVDWMATDPADLAPHVADFFLPARRLIALSGPIPAPRAIPTRAMPVHLVWPAPTPSPEEGRRITEAWVALGIGPVQVIPPEEGQAGLLRDHGVAAARAHAAAQDAEQRADLVMLGALLTRGGVAVRGAQWPRAGLADWLTTLPEATLVLSGAGAVDSAMMRAPPGHPLIGMAFEMACAACTEGAREHRWIKTGPGMLTRALARWILAGQAATAPVEVIALHHLRARLHPWRGE